uniref:C-type lectin domain-containing protein n=1 Tax=Pinctada fucata TaxID=50426 RepID=A0A194ANJ2_PINFU
MAYLWHISLFLLSVYLHPVESCVVASECEANAGANSCSSNGTSHWACISKLCECRSHDTSIFKYHTDYHSYDYAKDICLRENSQLVKVDSKAKYDLLVQFLNSQRSLSDCWIGLREDETQISRHIYRFQDGEISTFFQWFSGEPNSQSSDFCVRLDKDNKRMRTTTCRDRRPFVCEKVQEIGCTAKTDCKYKCATVPEYHCIDHKCSCAPLG